MPENNYFNNYNADKGDKRIILYVLVFSTAIIVSISLLFYNTKRINAHYAHLIETNTTLLELSNSCVIQNSVYQRMLLNNVVVQDSCELKKLSPLFASASNEYDNSFRKLSAFSKENSIISSELLAEIRNKRKEYLKAGDEFMSLIKAGDEKATSAHLLSTLRPRYDELKMLFQQVSKQVNQHIIESSNNTNRQSTLMAFFMLLVGLSPFLFIILRLLATKLIYR